MALWRRSFVALLVVISTVLADINLHNPRGGNNRMDEPNRDRRNANRLFDSQNNNRGGHNVGGLYYYGGSILPIQWANQHSCGDRNNNCELIIQYMCGKLVRDGTTITTIPDNPNNCYNWDCNTDLRYGMHETYDYYDNCRKRERNKGLFTADQNPRGNTAKYTRQERNGNRYGYECPEERDYYPYWHPTQWRDIAVLTNDAKRCLMYRRESENVKGRWHCKVEGKTDANTVLPNNKIDCEAFRYPVGASSESSVKGEWVYQSSHNLAPPDCRETQWSRDNHQGNTLGGYFMTYNWTLPDIDEENCVMRIRYNISTGEYDGFDPDVNANLNGAKMNIGARFGLDVTNSTKRGYIFRNDPDVSVFAGVDNFKLRIQINTDQDARTFQDRTHKFSIRKRPSSVPKNKRLYNVNVRGKRGNIVQVFPSTEYDFVPNTLNLAVGEYVHFQWTGSNTNDRNNAGQGLAGTDRSNVVPLADPVYQEGNGQQKGTHGHWGRSYPANVRNVTFLGLGRQDLVNLAINRPNQLHGELSELDDAGTYYDLGPRMVTQAGIFHYMSTRNNAFTNRSQKGRIIVTKNPSYSENIGWNGGSVSSGQLTVRVPPGFLSGLTYFQINKYTTDEIEGFLNSITVKRSAGHLPPGSGYASTYFLVKPDSGKLGCDQSALTITMEISKTIGVKIYQSTADPNYGTWKEIPAEIGVSHATFQSPSGGLFVARTV